MNEDITVGAVGIPNVATFNKKPPHLVVLNVNNNKKSQALFLSIDKPELLEGVIQVKGFFVNAETDNAKYFDSINNAPKESLVEMYFPLHRVDSVQNLMFRAK